MSRGWTWIDDSKVGDDDYDRLKPILDRLAGEWSDIHTTEERRMFLRQARMEEGDFDDYEFESEEDQKAHEARLQVERDLTEARMSAIENVMAKYNARMMRPYEHWNEDERFMEWSERDR